MLVGKFKVARSIITSPIKHLKLHYKDIKKIRAAQKQLLFKISSFRVQTFPRAPTFWYYPLFPVLYIP